MLRTLLLEEWSINFTHIGGATQESSKGGPCDQLMFFWHLSAEILRPIAVRTPHSWTQRLQFKMFSVLYKKKHPLRHILASSEGFHYLKLYTQGDVLEHHRFLFLFSQNIRWDNHSRILYHKHTSFTKLIFLCVLISAGFCLYIQMFVFDFILEF